MTLLFLPSLIGWLPIFYLILHLAIRVVADHNEDDTGSHPFRFLPLVSAVGSRSATDIHMLFIFETVYI